MTPTATAVAVVCGRCGSDDVLADASCEWDVDRQRWVLRGTYGFGECPKCGEVDLETKALGA